MSQLSFRLLGPLEVVADGRPVEVPGQKPRALLALLLLDANRVVPTDRLVEMLWDGRPTPTAAKALQVYVSQLRRLLGHERLATKPPGYLIRVEQDELDLLQFRALRESGRFREALALWRGPPLAEFSYQSFAQAEIARFEEERLASLEERIESDLLQGHHAELVGELEALVREHPLRERLHAQLMLALYRSGRQADALETYRRAREAMVEELGIEPSRELGELQQAILRQDPDLGAVAVVRPAEEQHEPPSVSPEPIAREVRKTVSVLVAAMTISSVSGRRLDPEARRRVTVSGFAEIRSAAERHGGAADAAGDSIIAVFGVPVVNEDDALRSIRAAVEARSAFDVFAERVEQESDVRLELRIGVSTGEVVAGGAQLQPTGEPLSLAQQLAQLAGPSEIVIDDATHRRVRAAVTVEPTDDAHRLLDVHRATQPVRLEAAMVGRARERRRLHDAFEQAVGDPSCQLFTVLGLAGVGKSRLVHEFLVDLAARSLVVGGRCLPYGEGITYWPLMEVVRDAAGLDDTESPDESLGKLAALLAEEKDAEQLARRVGELVGLAEGTTREEDNRAAVCALFESLARRTPLVIVFDDIHWGEPTFLDLLEHLADQIREAPVLLVCVARPELLDVRPTWGGGKLNATSVLLEPLSPDESNELIDELAGAELDDSARDRIVEAAEGNPLFLEEMLALALEDGGCEDELVVPPTIQALLAARLDRLGADERAVIEHAAIEGKVFYEDALAALAPETLRPQVASAIGSLLYKQLIRPGRPALGGRTFRFRHLLIRDAAYDSIPKEARAAMHDGFGTWLEAAAGDRVTEYEEVVGYHFEQAHLYRAELGALDPMGDATGRKAAERLGAAGRRAFARSDATAGTKLISRAAALLPAEDPARVDLVPNLRVVQGLSVDMSWADRVLTEAVEAAATSGNRRLAAHALVQRGLLRLFTEADVTPDELFGAAERARAVFEELGDELGMARAWRLTGQAHYLDRNLRMCATASERALEHARRVADRFEEHEIVEWLVIALLLGPEPAAAAAARCRQLLAETDHPRLQAEILGSLAMLVAMTGDDAEADELVERAGTMLDELGEQIWILRFWWSFILCWHGDPEGADRQLRPSYEALRKAGTKSHLSSICHALAHVVYMLGCYEEAERFTRECEEASRPNDVHSQIMWRAIRAKVLAREGELDSAERLAREAVAFAANGDFLLAHADAVRDLGEVLELAGRRRESAEAVDEAVRLYELKGNLAAAAAVRGPSP